MLVIRPAQLQALGASMQERFAEHMCGIFVQTYPRECRQAGGAAAMLGWVRSGLKSATEVGYVTEHDCGLWLALMLILGVDFAIDPQLPWVRDTLDPIAPNASDRLDLLLEQTLDYLSDTAGEGAGYEVRAMLRIRRLDFGAMPALQGDAAVADACERISLLYPRKFAFQGADLTAQTVAQHLSRAHAFGLRGPPGEFVFVLSSFMLGSGFDHDLLQPWAGAILHPPPGSPDDPSTRAQRLEAAALEHLAASLSKD